MREESRKLRSLITSLTKEDIKELKNILNVPAGIVERTNGGVDQFIFALRDELDDFKGAEFSEALERIGRHDLIATTKNIPWLCGGYSKLGNELEVRSFVKLLRDEMTLKDWKFIYWSEFDQKIGQNFTHDTAFYYIIEREAIESNLIYLCELMELVGRKDLEKKIQKFKPIFNNMKRQEIKRKLKTELRRISNPSKKRKLITRDLLLRILQRLHKFYLY